MGLPHPLFCAVGTETAVPISLGSDGGVVTSAVQSYIQYINIKGENEENGENMGKRGKYGNIWGKYGENHQEIDTKKYPLTGCLERVDSCSSETCGASTDRSSRMVFGSYRWNLADN